MKRISSIESQEKANSRRLNVFLDGQFAFSLHEDLAAHLQVGRFLSESEIADLCHQDGLRRVYDAALVLLSYRPRSTAELKSRLVRRGLDPAFIEAALGKLGDQGLVDDQQFARFWVENRQAHSPRGGRLLSAELRFKGIDREIVDEVLPSTEDEEEAAYRVAQRKARSLRGLDWQQFRHRLGDHLVRRGFDYETGATVVRRVWDGGAESDEG